MTCALMDLMGGRYPACLPIAGVPRAPALRQRRWPTRPAHRASDAAKPQTPSTTPARTHAGAQTDPARTLSAAGARA